MKIKLIFALVFAHIFVFSQNNENSPYSRYGLGDFINPSYSGFRAMGNTSVAIYDRFHINLYNPAAIAEAGTGMFEVAASAKKSYFSENNNNTSQWSGNLDYMALGFPLKNPLNEIYETKKKKYKLGMAFGLNKLTKLSYNITGIDSITNIGNFTRSYTGSGGTYKFQWANGVKFDNISFGLSIGYLFGGIEKTRSIVFDDLEYAFDDYITSKYHVKGLALSTGLLYHIKLNEKEAKDNANIGLKKLTIGLSYELPTKFSTNSDYLELSQQKLVNGAIINDTIVNDPDKKGNGKIPGTLGIGISYFAGEKHAFTAEVKTSNWSKYYNEATGEKEGDLQSSISIGAGGYFRPNFKSFTSFWKRAFYKYGFYYQKDPRKIINENLNNYGITLGVGMPFIFQRKVANTDINFDIGKSGSGTVIQEKYFKINFGFTFNDDEWFIKRKYN
jgi:hypothetical protein